MARPRTRPARRAGAAVLLKLPPHGRHDLRVAVGGQLDPQCAQQRGGRLSPGSPAGSPLEALERDAIVQSLLDSGGNKARAAGSLGMSRATLYRKIRDYGIAIPAR